MIEFERNKARLYRFILRLIRIRDSTGIYISKGSVISNGAVIGDGTRINGKIIIKGQGRCLIGKYCAIGDGIKIITTNHEKEVINLQYELSKRLGIIPRQDSRMDVFIGHNVWIGDNVIILPGVTIGNGAIIGAGSIVTKDINPYAVVAGVPARHIKFRFSEKRIQKIEQSSWWNWSEREMRNNISFFK